MTIPKPIIAEIPLSEGLRWRGGGGFRFEQKMDGRFAEFKVQSSKFKVSLLVGELMRSGEFYAFDVPVFCGVDVRRSPLIERGKLLDEIFQSDRFCLPPTFRRPAAGCGGEFLEFILSRGGEGVVAKDLAAPYGIGWTKCKRIQTFDLLVGDKDFARGSLFLQDPVTGEDRGKCPCKSEFDNVQVGAIVEVAAMCLHASGKLREPRFVRVRKDKTLFLGFVDELGFKNHEK